MACKAEGLDRWHLHSTALPGSFVQATDEGVWMFGFLLVPQK